MFLAAAPLIAGLLLSVLWIPTLRLEHAGVETRARVLARHDHQHGDVDVTYRVGGHTYVTTTALGEGNPDFDRVTPGDSVSLTYDPADRTLAQGGRIPRHTIRAVGIVMADVLALAAILVGGDAAVAAVARRRRTRGGLRATGDPSGRPRW